MKSLKVAFRCDGSPKIGMGHIYRCLTIANKFKEKVKNINILFITKTYKESINKIKKYNYNVVEIPKNIKEKYEADIIYKELKRFNANIIVIDILLIKKDYCQKLRDSKILTVYLDVIGKSKIKPDIIINDMALVKEWKNKYLDENITEYYDGPNYMILTDNFKRFHNIKKQIKENAENVLLTFGGSDPKKALLKVLNVLNNIEKDFNITIVIGPAFIYQKELGHILNNFKKPYTIKKDIDDLAELHYNSDLSIISGGKTVYESACVGTPSIIICQNEEQNMTAKTAEKKGIAINLGLINKIQDNDIKGEFLKLFNNRMLREKISKKGKEMIDSIGTERIVSVVLKKLNNKR